MKGWALPGTRLELISRAQLIRRSGHSQRGLEPTWLGCFDQNDAKKNPCRAQNLKQKVNHATTCLLTHGAIGYSVQETPKFTLNFSDWQNLDSFTYLQWTGNILECTPADEEIHAVFKTAQRDGNVRGRNVIRGAWAEWVWDKPNEQWDFLGCRTEFQEELIH